MDKKDVKELKPAKDKKDITTTIQNNVKDALLESDFMKNQKENAANFIFQKATEKINKGWFDCCNYLYLLQPYFNVENHDIRSRLLHSLVPFNPKFYDIIESNPDLYGPFWISTTLILTIAASGSLNKYLHVCNLFININFDYNNK